MDNDMRDTLNINRLPAPTWNWLHMNGARVENIRTPRDGRLEVEKPETILEVSNEGDIFGDIATGMGGDMDAFAESGAFSMRVFRCSEGVREDRPVRLHFIYEESPIAMNRIGLHAEDESEMTVVMDYAETAVGGGQAAVQTKLVLGKNAVIRLIQIQRMGDEALFLNDVGAVCAEGARVELIQLVLGGHETYMGARIGLDGDGSSFAGDIGYLLDKDEKLDMNYIAGHAAKKTLCDINASGVLRDNAFKLFRGTIDFRRGSGGSKGNEKEDVLLMSDGVVNQTVPLILCEEEDVEGNHGATIGRLDDDLLFYLQTRGIEKSEVYEMMARARIDAVCRKIPDERTRELVQGYVQ